jgi:hypothetical protein
MEGFIFSLDHCNLFTVMIAIILVYGILFIIHHLFSKVWLSTWFIHRENRLYERELAQEKLFKEFYMSGYNRRNQIYPGILDNELSRDQHFKSIKKELLRKK